MTPKLKVVGHAQWEHITVLMLLQCTTKVLKDHILCVWMIHDTCFHSAIWNATNQAFMLYVLVWLILLRQFVIHKQPSVYQDSCITCHAKYCPPMFTRNSHLSACSLDHLAECTCLDQSLLGLKWNREKMKYSSLMATGQLSCHLHGNWNVWFRGLDIFKELGNLIVGDPCLFYFLLQSASVAIQQRNSTVVFGTFPVWQFLHPFLVFRSSAIVFKIVDNTCFACEGKAMCEPCWDHKYTWHKTFGHWRFHLKNSFWLIGCQIQMWQSLGEIQHYSIAYFDCVIVVEVLWRRSSV